tara:strand:- start:738 stop:1463 length:726 start_codon:yes stop_codon:yes gene_type:complete
MLKKIIENVITLIYALLIAIMIRSLLIQPFYIPSSSMEPTLLVGDRIFVSKYDYGYSKHSFPFSPPIFSGRIFEKDLKIGDLVVFKTPSDNRTDYIKRLIAKSGQSVQFLNGNLIIDDKQIKKEFIAESSQIRCGPFSFKASIFKEELENGSSFYTAYNNSTTMLNSRKFIIPKNHFFFLGDNRDCSKDSRFDTIGYVNKENIVGKAKIIFFSNDTKISSFLKFWNWPNSIRFDRFFRPLH